ncbi:hypothetical protein C0J52_02734 [Blattella germanica]|nr:hypothetical protein C0J52_02734 [Blattella germanica]
MWAIDNKLYHIQQLTSTSMTSNSGFFLVVNKSCKTQRLRWFGHRHRMQEDKLVKNIYKWKPICTRTAGRPKNRWLDDITEDIK